LPYLILPLIRAETLLGVAFLQRGGEDREYGISEIFALDILLRLLIADEEQAQVDASGSEVKVSVPPAAPGQESLLAAKLELARGLHDAQDAPHFWQILIARLRAAAEVTSLFYLDSEDDFSYVPYGLDVFESLAKVCKQLKTSIDTEHAQSAPDLTAFVPLQGDTLVGKLIASLSAKTTKAQIDALATLTPEELAQHTALDKSLKENNPKEKATQTRLRARRVAAIASNATTKGALVDQAVVAKLRGLSDSYRTAQAAAANLTRV